MTGTRLRRLVRQGLLLCALLVLLPLAACTASPPGQEARTVRVTPVADPRYTLLPGGSVPDGGTGAVTCRGDDATLLVRAAEGWYISGVDYPGASLTEEDGVTSILLPAVERSVRVHLSCRELGVDLTYDPNGGEVLDPSAPLTVHCGASAHLRPNTAQGAGLFSRAGCTLTGWNTAPDGSGTAAGLGSRITADGPLTLYAQWAPWTEGGAFLTRPLEDGTVAVTGYTGSHEELVIPARLEGRPVTVLAAGAFQDCAARTVILPDTIRAVEDGAFLNAALETLYLYDSVERISDASFAGCRSLTTLHINAAEPPRYPAADKQSTYADKVDLLIRCREDRKIVVFSGSSAYFSVDALQMEQALEGYIVLNLALNSNYNAWCQLDIIKAYLQPGDVLLHAPEACSPNQLLAERAMNERMYRCLEENYDLFALVDLRQITNVFDAFQQFNDARAQLPGRSYDDAADLIDARGSYGPYREAQGEDKTITGEADILPDLLTGETLDALNGYYDSLDALGVRVAVTFAPVNLSALREKMDSPERTAYLFQRRLTDGLDPKYPVVGSFEDALFEGRYFFDSDYHLSSEATAFHTHNLIQWLRPCLEEVGRE